MTEIHDDGAPRVIAFHLPQYHPIPENDEWWGKGFTEWTNVTKANPAFPGHYQPHLPTDLGFYDLRLSEVREAQADMARKYGINGFCYYHYWFNGRRLLERPFTDILASGKPDFPFCLCWANENWTRVWDGGERHVLMEQHYTEEDDAAHIANLIPAFKDPRYIKIDGRPLFLIYRTERLPNPVRTAEIWRKAVREAGFPDIYLARVESFSAGVIPKQIGFDAAVEFVPGSSDFGPRICGGTFSQWLSRNNILPKGFSEHNVYHYRRLANNVMWKKDPDFVRFYGITPSWDNHSRRKHGATIFHGASPNIYEQWLRYTVGKALRTRVGDERIVFINAWNEWAEGNHLEPDRKWGRAYLDATLNGIRLAVEEFRAHFAQPLIESGTPNGLAMPGESDESMKLRMKRQYWQFLAWARRNFWNVTNWLNEKAAFIRMVLRKDPIDERK